MLWGHPLSFWFDVVSSGAKAVIAIASVVTLFL